MTIGDRLLELRKAKNLSQEDVANELDVSRQTVSKWETNQSTPDFDKIVPICKYFGITADELLTGNKNIVEAEADNIKSNFARNIAISVMLYIVSIVVLMLFAAQFNQPIIGISLFFVLVAIATGLIIYNSIYYEEKSKEEVSTKQNTLIKQVTSIIDTIGLIIYFVVSFVTNAWHITWVIFIIVGLINKIAKLLFCLKENDSIINPDTKEDKK